MEFIKVFTMFLSLTMCLFLFSYSYMELIRYFDNDRKGNFITISFTILMAFVFGFTANTLYV